MTISQPIPPAVLAQHVSVLGKTGSGKTSTAKLLVEQAFDAGDRICILDPIKSDWWGLISSADGKSAGLPFAILGVTPSASLDDAEAAYKRLAGDAHPDRGGSAEAMARLNRARDEARKEFGPRRLSP